MREEVRNVLHFLTPLIIISVLACASNLAEEGEVPDSFTTSKAIRLLLDGGITQVLLDVHGGEISQVKREAFVLGRINRSTLLVLGDSFAHSRLDRAVTSSLRRRPQEDKVEVHTVELDVPANETLSLRLDFAIPPPVWAKDEYVAGVLNRVKCHQELTVGRKRAFFIRLSPSCAKVALASLAPWQAVLRITGKQYGWIHNSRATSIVQGGSVSLDNVDASKVAWDIGLDGTGEYIGIGDTGVDTQNCYIDGKVSAARVVSGDDSVEDEHGHGTHVAGTLAGKKGGSDPALYDGIARGAKLVVVDAGSSGTLDIPSPLDEEYYPWMYRQGARTMSDSWGAQVNMYSSLSRELDQFLHDHRDTIIVHSAGNEGERGTKTITSPASAKNVLAVGASLSAFQGVPERSVIAFHFHNPNVYKPIVTLPASPADSSSFLALGPVKMMALDHDEACNATNDSAKGAAVLMASTLNPPCTTGDALRNLDAGGAAAILIDAGDCAPSQPKVLISRQLAALGGASSSSVTELKSVLSVIGPQEGMFAFREGSGSSFHLGIPSFSSKGPAPGGMLKPELLAPGRYLRSASAGSSCGTSLMSGTSTASPLVAGSVAIVRQYFRDGSHGDGPLNPSGMLVRAVLINGAQSMPAVEVGGERDGTPVEHAPSCQQGFGRVQISTSLPLDHPTSPTNLLVHDRLEIQEGGLVHIPVFVVPGEPLRVSLAWFDEPTLGYGEPSLLDDLDMVLVGRPLQGEVWRRPLGKKDSVNTVERVVMEEPLAGALDIFIEAPSLRATRGGTQKFALAISGNVKSVEEDLGGSSPSWHVTIASKSSVDEEMAKAIWSFLNASLEFVVSKSGVHVGDPKEIAEGCFQVTVQLWPVAGVELEMRRLQRSNGVLHHLLEQGFSLRNATLHKQSNESFNAEEWCNASDVSGDRVSSLLFVVILLTLWLL